MVNYPPTVIYCISFIKELSTVVNYPPTVIYCISFIKELSTVVNYLPTPSPISFSFIPPLPSYRAHL